MAPDLPSEMSIAEYAAFRGVGVQAIYKLLKREQIAIVPGKKPVRVDVARSEELRGHLMVTKDRRAPKDRQEPGAVTAATSSSPESGMNFLQARTANEVLKVKMQGLKVKQMTGELIERDVVERAVFDLARNFREAMLRWPLDVAPAIASELGMTDASLVRVTLEKHICQRLQELAEIEVSFQ